MASSDYGSVCSACGHSQARGDDPGGAVRTSAGVQWLCANCLRTLQ